MQYFVIPLVYFLLCLEFSTCAVNLALNSSRVEGTWGGSKMFDKYLLIDGDLCDKYNWIVHDCDRDTSINRYLAMQWDKPVNIGNFILYTDPSCNDSPRNCSSSDFAKPFPGRGMYTGQVYFLDDSGEGGDSYIMTVNETSGVWNVTFSQCITTRRLSIKYIDQHGCHDCYFREQRHSPIAYEWEVYPCTEDYVPDFSCDNTTEFTCPNGDCIPLDYVCDESWDCEDCSDEMDCEYCNVTNLWPECPDDGVCYFICDSGQCTDAMYVDDGYGDCCDCSDEAAGCDVEPSTDDGTICKGGGDSGNPAFCSSCPVSSSGFANSLLNGIYAATTGDSRYRKFGIDAIYLQRDALFWNITYPDGTVLAYTESNASLANLIDMSSTWYIYDNATQSSSQNPNQVELNCITNCETCANHHTYARCSPAEVSDCVCEHDDFCCGHDSGSGWDGLCVADVTTYGCPCDVDWWRVCGIEISGLNQEFDDFYYFDYVSYTPSSYTFTLSYPVFKTDDETAKYLYFWPLDSMTGAWHVDYTIGWENETFIVTDVFRPTLFAGQPWQILIPGGESSAHYQPNHDVVITENCFEIEPETRQTTVSCSGFNCETNGVISLSCSNPEWIELTTQVEKGDFSGSSKYVAWTSVNGIMVAGKCDPGGTKQCSTYYTCFSDMDIKEYLNNSNEVLLRQHASGIMLDPCASNRHLRSWHTIEYKCPPPCTVEATGFINPSLNGRYYPTEDKYSSRNMYRKLQNGNLRMFYETEAGSWYINIHSGDLYRFADSGSNARGRPEDNIGKWREYLDGVQTINPNATVYCAEDPPTLKPTPAATAPPTASPTSCALKEPSITCDSQMSGNTVGRCSVVGYDSGEVWYNFEVPYLTTVVIDACSSGFDTVLRLFDASATSELAFCDDCGACAPQTNLSVELSAGSYVLVLEGFNLEEGNYNIRVSCGPLPTEGPTDPPPPPPVCSNYGSGPEGGMAIAQTPFQERISGCQNATLFYWLHLPADLVLTVGTSEGTGNVDLYLSVNTPPHCSHQTVPFCHEVSGHFYSADYSSNAGRSNRETLEQLSITTSVSNQLTTTYFILVHCRTEVWDVLLQIDAFQPTPVPTCYDPHRMPHANPDVPNDNCFTASVISMNSSVNGSTILAWEDHEITQFGLNEIYDELNITTAHLGVWYRFVGNGENVTLTTASSLSYEEPDELLDTILVVFMGQCFSLSLLDHNDDFRALKSKLEIPTIQDEDYYVLVLGGDNSVGTFQLHLYEGSNLPPGVLEDRNEYDIRPNVHKVTNSTVLSCVPDNEIRVNQQFQVGDVIVFNSLSLLDNCNILRHKVVSISEPVPGAEWVLSTTNATFGDIFSDADIEMGIVPFIVVQMPDQNDTEGQSGLQLLEFQDGMYRSSPRLMQDDCDGDDMDCLWKSPKETVAKSFSKDVGPFQLQFSITLDVVISLSFVLTNGDLKKLEILAATDITFAISLEYHFFEVEQTEFAKLRLLTIYLPFGTIPLARIHPFIRPFIGGDAMADENTLKLVATYKRKYSFLGGIRWTEATGLKEVAKSPKTKADFTRGIEKTSDVTCIDLSFVMPAVGAHIGIDVTDPTGKIITVTEIFIAPYLEIVGTVEFPSSGCECDPDTLEMEVGLIATASVKIAANVTVFKELMEFFEIPASIATIKNFYTIELGKINGCWGIVPKIQFIADKCCYAVPTPATPRPTATPSPAPSDCTGDDCGGCTGDNCGKSDGDPHFRSLDGKRFDFQGCGTFWLVYSPTNHFFVQTRQYGTRKFAPGASVNGQIGIMIENHIITVSASLSHSSPIMIINNETAVGSEIILETEFFGNITINTLVPPFFYATPWTAVISWNCVSMKIRSDWLPSGSGVPQSMLSVQFSLPHWFKRETVGMLGPYDDNTGNDFTMRNGMIATKVKEFAESWRVTENDTLAFGTIEANYVNNWYICDADPSNISIADPGAIADAQLRCSAVDENRRDDCIFDLVVMGEASLVNEAYQPKCIPQAEVDCYGHGSCIEGICNCVPGFSGDDCSIAVKADPIAVSLGCPNCTSVTEDRVCGSDGITYPNECELTSISCLDPLLQLSLDHYRSCSFQDWFTDIASDIPGTSNHLEIVDLFNELESFAEHVLLENLIANNNFVGVSNVVNLTVVSNITQISPPVTPPLPPTVMTHVPTPSSNFGCHSVNFNLSFSPVSRWLITEYNYDLHSIQQHLSELLTSVIRIDGYLNSGNQAPFVDYPNLLELNFCGNFNVSETYECVLYGKPEGGWVATSGDAECSVVATMEDSITCRCNSYGEFSVILYVLPPPPTDGPTPPPITFPVCDIEVSTPGSGSGVSVLGTYAPITDLGPTYIFFNKPTERYLAYYTTEQWAGWTFQANLTLPDQQNNSTIPATLLGYHRYSDDITDASQLSGPWRVHSGSQTFYRSDYDNLYLMFQCVDSPTEPPGPPPYPTTANRSCPVTITVTSPSPDLPPIDGVYVHLQNLASQIAENDIVYRNVYRGLDIIYRTSADGNGWVIVESGKWREWPAAYFESDSLYPQLPFAHQIWNIYDQTNGTFRKKDLNIDCVCDVSFTSSDARLNGDYLVSDNSYRMRPTYTNPVKGMHMYHQLLQTIYGPKEGWIINDLNFDESPFWPYQGGFFIPSSTQTNNGLDRHIGALAAQGWSFYDGDGDQASDYLPETAQVQCIS